MAIKDKLTCLSRALTWGRKAWERCFPRGMWFVLSRGSIDGSADASFGGFGISGQPCVWCDGLPSAQMFRYAAV